MTLHDLALVLAMALAVYLPKALPILLLDRLPRPIENWLAYVAPAVLGALVGPTVLGSFADGTIGLREAGFAATAAVAARSRNVLLAGAAGMALIVAGELLGK
jgi:branched-subunit amino acid transport protein